MIYYICIFSSIKHHTCRVLRVISVTCEWCRWNHSFPLHILEKKSSQIFYSISVSQRLSQSVFQVFTSSPWLKTIPIYPLRYLGRLPVLVRPTHAALSAVVFRGYGFVVSLLNICRHNTIIINYIKLILSQQPSLLPTKVPIQHYLTLVCITTIITTCITITTELSLATSTSTTTISITTTIIPSSLPPTLLGLCNQSGRSCARWARGTREQHKSDRWQSGSSQDTEQLLRQAQQRPSGGDTPEGKEVTAQSRWGRRNKTKELCTYSWFSEWI